jgi:hypothetical protein
MNRISIVVTALLVGAGTWTQSTLVFASSTSQATGMDIYVTPCEHDDRLHKAGSLDEAASYLHNQVLPWLEADSSRTYVLETVYTLRHALNKYPADAGRVRALLQKGQLAVSGNYIAYSSNHHEQETAVRLVTYGKWYLRNRFGYDTKFVLRPDSPGFTPQTGQIYHKAGIDLFVNNRLTYLTDSYVWYWVGLDGSRTLALHPHYDYGRHSGSIYDRNKKGLDTFAAFSPEASWLGHQMFDGLSSVNWPTNVAWIMVGNDNSMPSLPNIQAFVRGWNAEAGQDKPMRFSNLTDFAERIKGDAESGKINLEQWSRWGMCWGIRGDDDNFPPFRRLNQSRRRMLDLEKLASLCEICGLSGYPSTQIQEDWDKILFPRDHSNLTYVTKARDGTSFSDVARAAEARIDSVLNDRLRQLANTIHYRRPGTPVLIFNTLNWNRTEPVELRLVLPPGRYKAIAPQGAEVPLQVLSSADRGGGKRTYHLLLMASEVPSLGYKVFYLVPGDPSQETDLSSGPGLIENQYYRIQVDAQGFRSMYDKGLAREIVARGRASKHRKTQDGEVVNFGEVISSKFFDGPVDRFAPLNYLKSGSLISRMAVDDFSVLETGPVRATLRLNAHLGTERLVISVNLLKGLQRVGLKYELVRSGHLLDGNADGEPDYVTVPLPFRMSDNIRQQFGVVYGSMDNPVLADIAQPNVQWPTARESPGRIIGGGFSQHQRSAGVKGQIGYRFHCGSDKKLVHEWTDVREADDSFGVTIAHPGVIQYERLNFVAPVLCAWEPGLRAYGVNYENAAPWPYPDSPPTMSVKSIPGENYSVDLLLKTHRGSWDASEAYRLGSEKNYPLLVGYAGDLSEAKLSESASFINVTPAHAILTAFKKAEDGSGYAARFYEASDTDCSAGFTFAFPWNIATVRHTNLLEDDLADLPVRDDSVSVKVRGFGIETLKLSLGTDARGGPLK